MSSNQHTTDRKERELLAERQALRDELETLRSAPQPEAAAEEIARSLEKTQDPFLFEQDNEFATPAGGKPCCALQ